MPLFPLNGLSALARGGTSAAPIAWPPVLTVLSTLGLLQTEETLWAHIIPSHCHLFTLFWKKYQTTLPYLFEKMACQVVCIAVFPSQAFLLSVSELDGQRLWGPLPFVCFQPMFLTRRSMNTSLLSHPHLTLPQLLLRPMICGTGNSVYVVLMELQLPVAGRHLECCCITEKLKS